MLFAWICTRTSKILHVDGEMAEGRKRLESSADSASEGRPLHATMCRTIIEHITRYTIYSHGRVSSSSARIDHNLIFLARLDDVLAVPPRMASTRLDTSKKDRG